MQIKIYYIALLIMERRVYIRHVMMKARPTLGMWRVRKDVHGSERTVGNEAFFFFFFFFLGIDLYKNKSARNCILIKK
jgi:hypothetical protein